MFGFNFDDWLTVHRSITLINLQLDAPIFIYLHTIHLLKSSTCFEHHPAQLQEVYVAILYIQPLVSSPAESDDTRAAYIQLRRRPPEDEQDDVRKI
jgi:hypothetical protein